MRETRAVGSWSGRSSAAWLSSLDYDRQSTNSGRLAWRGIVPPDIGFERGGTTLIEIDPFENVPTYTPPADTSPSVVRTDALRNFRQVVDALGGDPDVLLAKSQIDSAVLENRHAVISYRMMVHLLERAAGELKCPDFGILS